jgi:DNA polymerase
MFIGEAPGFHENKQGKPFVGQAGQFLDDLLNAAGLDRSQVYITNVVKCRPPNNRDPLPDELAACQTYLDEQIGLLQPTVIVTLGRISMGKFVDAGRISAIHGKTHKVNGQKVVTMYHPAAALHQPALRQTLLDDFARLKKFIGTKEIETPAPLPLDPEPEEEPEPAPLSTAEFEDTTPPEQLSLF